MSLPPPKITIAWKDIHQEALGSAVVGVLKFLRRTKVLSLKPQKPKKTFNKTQDVSKVWETQPKRRHVCLPSLNLTANASKNGWLEYDPFLLGSMLVSGRVSILGTTSFCSKGKLQYHESSSLFKVDMARPHMQAVFGKWKSQQGVYTYTIIFR